MYGASTTIVKIEGNYTSELIKLLKKVREFCWSPTAINDDMNRELYRIVKDKEGNLCLKFENYRELVLNRIKNVAAWLIENKLGPMQANQNWSRTNGLELASVSGHSIMDCKWIHATVAEFFLAYDVIRFLENHKKHYKLWRKNRELYSKFFTKS